MLSELTVDLWAHGVPAAPHGKNPNQDASGSGSPDTSGRGRVHLGLGAGKVAAGLALPEVEWPVGSVGSHKAPQRPRLAQAPSWGLKPPSRQQRLPVPHARTLLQTRWAAAVGGSRGARLQASL